MTKLQNVAAGICCIFEDNPFEMCIFFFHFFFPWLHLPHMKVLRLGVESEYSSMPVPQP